MLTIANMAIIALIVRMSRRYLPWSK